jgi:hypothetical protein
VRIGKILLVGLGINNMKQLDLLSKSQLDIFASNIKTINELYNAPHRHYVCYKDTKSGLRWFICKPTFGKVVTYTSNIDDALLLDIKNATRLATEYDLNIDRVVI